MRYKNMQKVLAFALLASSWLLASCGNNGCEETRESYLCVNLKATGRIELKALNVWALTDDGDSLKIKVKTPTDLELNLKPDTTVTRFRLQCIFDDLGDDYQTNDTLIVRYTSFPYYLNMECGCSMFYAIEEVSITDHLFKNLTLESNEISNEEKTNIILKY